MTTPLPIAVLISGGGTTLKNLLQVQSQGNLPVEFRLVISSNPQAKGLAFAAAAHIPTFIAEKKSTTTASDYSTTIFNACRGVGAKLVVMGGFLKHVRIPSDFENRVLNIHPSLIPEFCGYGMYGHFVHEAVIKAGAKHSGCTVHFVDNEFDHGPIVLQKEVPVLSHDTPESLAERVFQVECEALPEAIRLFAAGRLRVENTKVRVLPAE
jgi:phosphoribosylglycinamide formyltransferase-1